MKLTIHDNWHDGVKGLPKEAQDAFYGALVRYAMDGEEPSFSGVEAAVWGVIKPFVDKAAQAQDNGAKGGNGRGNKGSKTISENPLENPPVKPPRKTPSKTPMENQIEKNGREGNRTEGKGFPSHKEGKTTSPLDGAGGEDPAPPRGRWACPTCDSTAYPKIGGGWSCPRHIDIPEAVWVPDQEGVPCPEEERERIAAILRSAS